MNNFELERLLRTLRDSLRAIQQSVDGIHQQSQASHDQQSGPANADLRSIIPDPVAITAYYKSEERERPQKSAREAWRIRREWLTLAAAIVAAIFTYRTLYQIKRQADATQQQLEIAGRGWIGITDPEVAKLTYPNGVPTFEFSANIRNVGHTAADAEVSAYVANDFDNRGTAWVTRVDAVCQESSMEFNAESHPPAVMPEFPWHRGFKAYGTDITIGATPIKPVLIGCITYRSGKAAVHQTAFVASIYMKGKGAKDYPPVVFDGVGPIAKDLKIPYPLTVRAN